RPFTRLVGIGLLSGLISVSMGVLGPSTYSMDRFDDTIFYLVAALLVLRGHERWIPPLMVLAVANRETSVFVPTLILARYGWRSRFISGPRAWAKASCTSPQRRSSSCRWCFRPSSERCRLVGSDQLLQAEQRNRQPEYRERRQEGGALVEPVGRHHEQHPQ